MNGKKQKMIKNMLNISAIILGNLCYPNFFDLLNSTNFLQFVVGNSLLDEAPQNLYQIGEIILTGIIFFICYFLTKKKITSVSNKATILGILNIIMALLNGFIIPFIFAHLSSNYIINVLLPKSQEAYSCFVGTEKIIELFNPLLFTSITLFLCAYVVYWVEMVNILVR